MYDPVFLATNSCPWLEGCCTTTLPAERLRDPQTHRQRKRGQKDEEVLQLQYLGMVNVIGSLELFLQCASILLHAAADCTCQVALTVQVTYGDRNKEIKVVGNR